MRPEVLWCSNQRRGSGNGWAFPPNVRRRIEEDCRGAWLVRVGDNCHVRALQYFAVVTRPGLVKHFQRGPAMKYNRWLAQPNSLQLIEASE